MKMCNRSQIQIIYKGVTFVMNEADSKEIEDLLSENGFIKPRWIDDDRSTYYYIDSCFTVQKCTWSSHKIDYLRFNNGNCFRTIKNAEYVIGKMQEMSEDMRR